MIAIFIELVVFAVLLLRQRVPVFRHKKGMQVAVVTAFAVVLVGLLWWLGGKELTTRVSSIATETHTELSGGMRLSIDRDAFRMFRNRPVLGWGLGTFPTVYPSFAVSTPTSLSMKPTTTICNCCPRWDCSGSAPWCGS